MLLIVIASKPNRHWECHVPLCLGCPNQNKCLTRISLRQDRVRLMGMDSLRAVQEETQL